MCIEKFVLILVSLQVNLLATSIELGELFKLELVFHKKYHCEIPVISILRTYTVILWTLLYTGGVSKEKEKARLANIMEFGTDIPPRDTKQKRPLPQSLPEVDRFDECKFSYYVYSAWT